MKKEGKHRVEKLTASLSAGGEIQSTLDKRDILIADTHQEESTGQWNEGWHSQWYLRMAFTVVSKMAASMESRYAAEGT